MSETTDAPKAIEAPAATRRVQELNPANGRFETGDFLRVLYVVTPHENTGPEDLLKPEYWVNVAEKFKPFDKVEARADDGSWYAEYLVLETSRKWTRMHMLASHNLTTQDVSLTQSKLQEFAVEFKGPHRKHCVIRLSDQEIIHEGESTKSGAHAWLAERIKAGI